MASKKCPKCGEDNPAEAVMCWACYTPLSGGAAAAATSAAASAVAGGKAPAGLPTSVDEDKPKKSIDPKLIGGGAALVVLLLIGFAVKSMSGGAEDDGASGGGGGGDPTPTPASDGGGTTGPAPVAPSLPPSGGAAPPAPMPLPFTAVTSPNPTYATGTIGILVTQPNITTTQAAGFAKFAKNQFSRQGRWQRMQICVFADPGTADTFKKYQSGRKGAPLSATDYDALSSRGVWGGTPAFMESIGSKDLVYYPSKNPYSWWSSR